MNISQNNRGLSQWAALTRSHSPRCLNTLHVTCLPQTTLESFLCYHVKVWMITSVCSLILLQTWAAEDAGSGLRSKKRLHIFSVSQLKFKLCCLEAKVTFTVFSFLPRLWPQFSAAQRQTSVRVHHVQTCRAAACSWAEDSPRRRSTTVRGDDRSEEEEWRCFLSLAGSLVVGWLGSSGTRLWMEAQINVT